VFFSLRNRFLLMFTCLLTIPFLILSIIIPSFFTSIIREQTQESTLEMMNQYSLYVDSITTQAEDLGKQVMVNQTTQDWLRKQRQSQSSEESIALLNQLRELLTSIMINNSKMMTISVQLNDGTGTWGNNTDIDNVDWFHDFIKNDQRFVKSHLDSFQQSYEMRSRVINSYILPLIDTNTLMINGTIKVNFPSELLDASLNKIKLGKNGSAYMITEHGENVLPGNIMIPNEILNHSLKDIKTSNKKEGLIEAKYNKENYLVFYQKLPVGGWILISEVTESDLFSKVNQLQRNLFITSAFVFVLTIVVSFILSNNITSPLGKLANAMRFIERGDFTEAIRVIPAIQSPNNEVSYLINVTNRTIDRLKKLIETEYEANLRRKDAEYKALLLQINPHFLNNTLEIIGSLAVQGKNKEVMNVSVYLGRMLRYSLDTKSNVVTLGEELKYIKSYTDILSLRYEDSIKIQIEEDPLTKTVPIVKFILQPLVENAVKYSYQEKAQADILIKTEKISSKIFIVVEDKGIGMSHEVISNLVTQTEETISVLDSSGFSIGLRNVLGRLRLYYGHNFSYNIESKKNEGTKITFIIDLK